jgi:hypothetical protein
VVEEKQYDILVTKWLTRRVEQLNIYNSRNYQWGLTIIRLGHDPGIGHAISIVGDLIFDSTHKHALKFCKKALDDQGFLGVYMVVSFAIQKHMSFDIYNPYN